MSLIDVKVPALGESVTEATIARWHKNVGDTVQMDEVLIELETDKVTLEITAPSSGVLKDIKVSKGTVVSIGTILGAIDSDAKATMPTVAPETKPTIMAPEKVILAVAEKAPPAPATETTGHMSPAVRKHVGDHQLDASRILSTSGDGRLSKADVLNYVNKKTAQGTQSSTVSTSSTPSASLQGQSTSLTIMTDDRLEKRVPMSRLRLRVSERLKYAQNTAAILTTFNEIDMTAVKQLRDRYKDVFEKKYGIKLGFMSFFVKACVQALKEIPMVNSRIEGDEIVTNNYCDIGVAVSAPQGLVVPIVRDAELLDLAGIERAIAGYGKKAKDGKLTMEEMTGGTFTISNGGVFGSLFSTPIINPPQSAILGMHKIQDRPMAVDGRVEIRPMMYVALSYDHRLIDGREAVTFLVTIKDCIENPGRFLLEL
jgi:2-oxoglutarate dehydrogenase E2 component (dihydrolipoamide succinyltransferase)